MQILRVAQNDTQHGGEVLKKGASPFVFWLLLVLDESTVSSKDSHRRGLQIRLLCPFVLDSIGTLDCLSRRTLLRRCGKLGFPK